MIRQFVLLTALAASFQATSLLALEPKVVTEAAAMTKAGKHAEAIAALEGALKTSPKDAVALKTALADSYTAQGESIMFNEQLPPRQKYAPALRSFRKALEYDKTNAKAKANIKTIEDIYTSMGRPIPQ
ncbi:MAG: hypothetical protein K2X03_02805 [Bryobacteraceae bacterium]|nr:hypothetical protein [Bryobacteraceae bacterium]